MAQVLRHAPPVALDRAREYAGGVARVDVGVPRVEPLRAHQPLHVVHVFQPETGGVPAYVTALSAGLLEAGLRVSVAGPAGAPALARLRALGIETLPLGLVHHPHPVKDALAVRALVRWCRQRQVSVIHGHSTKAGMLAALAGARADRPSVYTPHCWSFDQRVGLPLRAAYAAFDRGLVRGWHSGVVCVSAAERASAERWRVVPASQVEVVPTGVTPLPTVDRGSAREALGLPEDDIVAVWVGRPGAQKRPADLNALARRARGRVRVLALCHGAHGTVLEFDLRSAGVTLAPPGTDPALAYAAADLMVQTSAWESASIAVLEAMAAGLPIVAYDVGGVGEQVRPGRTGYLVAPGDIEMLGDCVLALARRPSLRTQMGQAARRDGQERFSFESMVRDMVDTYTRHGAGRAPARSLTSARERVRARGAG